MRRAYTIVVTTAVGAVALALLAVTTRAPDRPAAAPPGTPSPSRARPLVREAFPAQSLALSADVDGDGVVTREEIADACARAVAAAGAEFAGDWERKLATYGMRPGSDRLDLDAIMAAAAGIAEGADADGDGRTTPGELRAYAEARDPALRPDIVGTALALDADADMTVTRAEVAAARAAFARDRARHATLPEASREAIVHPTRADGLADWTAAVERIADGAIDLWKRAGGVDGRASLAAIAGEPPDPPPPRVTP